MKSEKIEHPTEKEIESFYHDRCTMENSDWVATHIQKCRKCLRKFRNLKKRFRFEHHGTTFSYNHKSLDLLWVIQPETAKRITTCLAATSFVHYKHYETSSPEAITLYTEFLLILKDHGVKNPERYFDYQKVNDAWVAFDYAAQWLARMEKKERFNLFAELVRVAMHFLDGIQSWPSLYIDHTTISYMARKLDIPEKMACDIVEDELWTYQENWKVNESCEYRDFAPGFRSSNSLLRMKPEVAARMIRCFSAILFMVEELSSISTLEEMEDHLEALETLRDFGCETPEAYLTYKNDEEAQSAFKEAAKWLCRINVDERVWLFYRLLRLSVVRFNILSEITTPPYTILIGKIPLLNNGLEIPMEFHDPVVTRLKYVLSLNPHTN